MRRHLLPLLLAVFLFLSACTAQTDANQADNKREDPGMDQIVSNMSAVHIRDLAENRFEKPLDLTLTDEELSALRGAMSSLLPKETSFGGYAMYALDFMDQDGKLLGSLLVDSDVTLEWNDGTSYRRQGEADKVLSALEERAGLRASLYTRRPGAGYFDLFSQVDRGYLYEITENNFIEGLKKDLGKEDVAALREALSGSIWSAERLSTVPAKYIAELYSRGGGLLYRFTFDENGRVYGLENYELSGSTLNDWLAAQCS